MKKWLLGSALLFALVLMAANANNAQGIDAVATRPPTPQPPKGASIKMADGLAIQGDYYAPAGGDKGPAILLMHQQGGSSYDWKDFANVLLKKGYTVLAVDLRGSGMTGGGVNWPLAQSDTVALMSWLRDQPTVDPKRVAVMGASIGANLALRGCADDDACRVVIALSPGINYFGVSGKDAMTALRNKAILLAASQEDLQSGDPTKYLTTLADRTNNILTRDYASSVMHGMGLFTFKDFMPLVTQWLDEFN